MTIDHDSDVPPSDDAPTYNPGATVPARLHELARLMRSGQAPPFCLVVLAPDDVLIDIETDILAEAQEMLLALLLAVQKRQQLADEWAMITDMSEASSVPEENP